MAADDQGAARKRGRPAHQPTAETQARVARLTAEGASVATIAPLLGISKVTLRVHYARELAAHRPQTAMPFAAEADLGRAPPRDTDPGGRPMHVPSDDSRDEVEVLAAAGMHAWQIAANLAISEPTLRLHYAEQLMLGAARKKGQMIVSLFKAGKDGNVAAQKAFIAQCREYGDAPVEDRASRAAEVKLGKKEQQLAAAQSPNPDSAIGALMAERLGLGGGRLN